MAASHNKEDLIAALIAAAWWWWRAFFQTATGRAPRAVADLTTRPRAQSIGIPLNRIWVRSYQSQSIVALVAGMIRGSKLGVPRWLRYVKGAAGDHPRFHPVPGANTRAHHRRKKPRGVPGPVRAAASKSGSPMLALVFLLFSSQACSREDHRSRLE